MYLGCNLARQGNLSSGYRFALLGKALVDKLGVHEMKAEVFVMVSSLSFDSHIPTAQCYIAHMTLPLQASELQLFCEPAQAANEVRIQGEHAAIQVGSINWACINLSSYCVEAFWMGSDLSSINKVILCSCPSYLYLQHSYQYTNI